MKGTLSLLRTPSELASVTNCPTSPRVPCIHNCRMNTPIRAVQPLRLTERSVGTRLSLGYNIQTRVRRTTPLITGVVSISVSRRLGIHNTLDSTTNFSPVREIRGYSPPVLTCTPHRFPVMRAHLRLGVLFPTGRRYRNRPVRAILLRELHLVPPIHRRFHCVRLL